MILQSTLYCEIDYPYESNDCYVVDKYDNKHRKLKLQRGINLLRVLESGLFYKDSLGNRFLTYPCEGSLSFEIAKKCLDFSELDVSFLDYFCAKLEHDKNATNKDRKLVELFLECFELGVYPNGFLRLQRELLGVEDETTQQ